MDPDACLQIIDEELENEDPDQEVIAQHIRDLKDWILRGGFQPRWERCPTAFSYLERMWSHCSWEERILPSGASTWKLLLPSN